MDWLRGLRWFAAVQAPPGRHAGRLAPFILLVAAADFVLSEEVLSVRLLLVVSLALLLAGLGCDSGSRGLLRTSQKLSGTDCKPRKLTKMQTCAGEDHSFQECGFFFRATGVPDRSWCQALAAQAQASSPSPACDWGNPAAWRPVACATYNVHGAARCFSCSDAQPEAGKTYVYAYDATCTHGIEQATCNVDPVQAGAKLGPARF